MYHWIANYLEITNIKSIYLCIQHAKSSIETILSKIFEQNLDYTIIDQFPKLAFKMMTSTEK